MPIQPNFLERTAFFTLNAAPGPMLDLAGALAFQAVNTAVRLNLFTTLQERPSTPTELAQSLNCQERGLEKLPGGKVVIFDQVAGKQFGTATNAIVQLVGLMYYLFADGRIFTRAELTTLLSQTGFQNNQFYPMRQAPGSSLLVAEK